jgi:23S rRNA (adenine2503-C2)-methyltransferase
VRRPRGQDIMAACGQLKSASERAKAGARAPADAGLVAPSA